MRSKIRWFTEFCNSHYVSHFAAFFIVARAKISVVESCLWLMIQAGPRARTASVFRSVYDWFGWLLAAPKGSLSGEPPDPMRARTAPVGRPALPATVRPARTAA